MQPRFSSTLTRTINLVALLACAAPALRAQTTIYSDTFSRSGTLKGSAPDIRPGSETWTGNTTLSTNGTTAYYVGTGDSYQPGTWLPLSITNGITYSAKVTVSMAATGTYYGAESTCWVALGFGAFPTAGTGMTSYGGPWLLLRNNGGAQLFRTGTTEVITEKPAGTYPTATDIRLDYTRASDGTAVASYFINGTLVTTYNYATAPDITGIGIQVYYQPTTTTFDNFTLSSVPEPSTYAALAGLCVLGFAACRRRKTTT